MGDFFLTISPYRLESMHELKAPSGTSKRARAQYRGVVRFTLMGMTINGTVQSVMEFRSSTPKRWIVRVVTEEKAARRKSESELNVANRTDKKRAWH